MDVVDKKEKIPIPGKRTITCLEGSALRGKYCHIPILAAEPPTQTRRTYKRNPEDDGHDTSIPRAKHSSSRNEELRVEHSGCQGSRALCDISVRDRKSVV